MILNSIVLQIGLLLRIDNKSFWAYNKVFTERSSMSRIQVIDSITIGNTKLTLLDFGKKKYQIETKTKTNTEVFNFEGEYNSAMCEFIQKAVKLNKEMA